VGLSFQRGGEAGELVELGELVEVGALSLRTLASDTWFASASLARKGIMPRGSIFGAKTGRS
jgi:hypothetical protein